ncbi:hypothetical protein BURPS305_7525 [Burkholderia pseudomallei 305]|nr:hypothetical protein BURPS305_7525 [Burkholderia pseudomallei 305]
MPKVSIALRACHIRAAHRFVVGQSAFVAGRASFRRRRAARIFSTGA